MNEIQIKEFWNRFPCGEALTGSLLEHDGDYESFFSDYDRFRYNLESHIVKCLDRIAFQGKLVLEIGLGQGADSEQIIRRGGIWSGLDLTQESVNRVATRLRIRKLPFRELRTGSVLEIPFENSSFDIIFSHGVLHHVPDIRSAQRELHRVLRPNGMLVVMLYSKWSLNYLLSICVVRRLGLMALWFAGLSPEGIYRQHLENAKRIGLWRYLGMDQFIHTNTDGPLNPYSKVYDLRAVKADFSSFEVEKIYKRFMHSPPVPSRWLPLERLLGWHLWAHMRPK